MLKASGITKSYGSLQVLNGVDLELAAGEVVSLVGASGAGKSTLLQVLGTLDQPDTGKVLFDGVDVFGMNDKEQANFRNQNIGFVFQFHHLLPEFDALENVCLPAFIAGTARNESMEKGKAMLERLKLGERLDHRPSELSGGEQQRVAIARALINSPKLILADEPTGNLDSANSENIYDLIFELANELNVAFLIATHSEYFAQRAARQMRIQDGVLASAVVQ